MNYKTEQEKFWAGEFGNEYAERNKAEQGVICNIALFAEILKRTSAIRTVLEFGPNIGRNIKALKTLFPDAKYSAVEINHKAAESLRSDPVLAGMEVFETSILDYEADRQFDFVFTKGVLIHINPDVLQCVYQKLYDSSSKYICLVEYYNPSPVTVKYRENLERLFKRDFCGEFMDKFPDVRLIDYGFQYHRDNHFPQDDLTWFLLEK